MSKMENFLTILLSIFLICMQKCYTQRGRPVIRYYYGEQPILEGRALTLECSHSYNRREVQYRWIVSSAPKNAVYESGSRITFTSVHRKDHVFVSCEVFSVTGSLGVSRHVLVEANYMDRPEIISDDWDVRKSDSVALKCMVNSHPDFEYIEIFKDGKKVHTGSRYEIVKVEKSHAGKYSCRAKNKYFTKTSSIKELSVGGISTKAIHVMAYFGGVFFPLLVVLLVCITGCRHFSRQQAKRKLRMLTTDNPSPTDTTNLESALKEDDIYYVGRYQRNNDVIPPSYDEAVMNGDNLPPSYDEITQTQPTNSNASN